MASSDKCSGGVYGIWLDNNLYHTLKKKKMEEEEEEKKKKEKERTNYNYHIKIIHYTLTGAF